MGSRSLSQRIFETRRRIRAFIAVLHDHGCSQMKATLVGEPATGGAGTRDHHGTLGNLLAQFPAVHEVVITVEPVMITPEARTARRRTTMPSKRPTRPPTKVSSSTTTGTAPAGSSTPPIWAQRKMHASSDLGKLPTKAWLSTMVPSPM